MTGKILTVLLISLSGILAQTSREKIAVLPIQSTAFKSKSEELTERILDELFKSDLYIVREQAEVLAALDQEGMRQGCVEKICAVLVGEILRVDKVIYGTVKQKEGVFRIRLAMVDVKTDDIWKKSTHNVQGGYKDVISSGMMKATRALIGTEYTQTKETGSGPDRSAVKKTVRLVSAIVCATAAVGFGGASAYYWNEKDTNPAVIMTACSGAFLTTSIILFVIKPEGGSSRSIACRAGFRPGEYHLGISCRY